MGALGKVLVACVVFAGALSLAASLETKSGEVFEGEVKAISERGVVFRTDRGTHTVLPSQVRVLRLDRPWTLVFADGRSVTGGLEVREGTWFFNGRPLNFHSVFAFSPSKTVTAQGAMDPASASSETSPAPSTELPRGEVRVSGRWIRGEVLAIRPTFLLLMTREGFKEIRPEVVEAFHSDVPWTVVDRSGKRRTGQLEVKEGHWTVGGVALDWAKVRAFVPRLDLRTRAANYGSAALSRSDLCFEPERIKAPPRVDVSGWELGVAVKTAGDFAQSGDRAEAIRIYRQVTEENPESVQAWIRLGHEYRKVALACSEAGKDQRASTYYDLALAAFKQAADRADRAHDQKEAAYWFSRVKREKAWGPRATEMFEKGYLAFQKNDYLAAKQFFERAAEANPTMAEAYYWQGRALLKLGRREEAVRAFQKALSIDPKFKPAQEHLLELGVLAKGLALKSLLQEAYRKEAEGALEEARKLYLEAIRRFPNSFQAHYRLGLLDRRLGLWEEAEEALRQAAALADEEGSKQVRYWLKRLPKDALYGIRAVDAFEKGYQLFASGRFEGAAELFAEASRLAPSWADAYYWQARSLLELHQNEEARALLEKVLEQEPGHKAAFRLLKKLR